jgi:hypothetical protein
MLLITQEQLFSRLKYDPDTGVFTHLSNKGGIRIGSVAGSNDGKGYLEVQLFGQSYLCHRLAWLYVTGCWPTGQIDHKNGIRDDNRFSNLRDVTHAENRRNLFNAKRNSKSGLIGASWKKAIGKFRASITINKKYRHLGYFDNAEDAHAAYMAAKQAIEI